MGSVPTLVNLGLGLFRRLNDVYSKLPAGVPNATATQLAQMYQLAGQNILWAGQVGGMISQADARLDLITLRRAALRHFDALGKQANPPDPSLAAQVYTALTNNLDNVVGVPETAANAVNTAAADANLNESAPLGTPQWVIAYASKVCDAFLAAPHGAIAAAGAYLQAQQKGGA